MPQSWEQAAFLSPPPGSNNPGAAPVPTSSGVGSGGFDDFALPGSSGRGSGSARSTGSGGTARGRGTRGGRGRGSSSRAGPTGGRGRLPRTAASPRYGGAGSTADDFALNPPPAQKKTRQPSKASYYPRTPESGAGGPASILVQLLLFEGEGNRNPELKTLQAAAQRFCADPMVAPAGPHNTSHTKYSAWNSMSTLEKKGLVSRSKRGRKHTFSLEPEGRAIAERFFRENRALFMGVDYGGAGGAGSSSTPNPFSPPRQSGSSSSSGGGSSSSPNPFSLSRRNGGPSSNPARKSNFSPVTNPYASGGGIAAGSSSNCTGIGQSGGGGGRISGVKNPALVAAEARRSKEVASKTAAAAAAAATPAVGTSRGRALQERGKEKHAKRAKLYEATSPGSQCFHRGLKPSADAGSTLRAVLKQCGQVDSKKPSSAGISTAAVAAVVTDSASSSKKTASSSKKTASSNEKNEHGGGCSSEQDLGMVDDDWMALSSRPAKKSSPVITPSSPPLRNQRRATSSNPYKTTLGVSKGKGSPAVVRSAPSPAPSASASSLESEVQRRGNNADSPAAAAAAGVEDVVDISLSDDEEDGDDDDGQGDIVLTPPPDLRAGASSSKSISGSGGGLAGSRRTGSGSHDGVGVAGVVRDGTPSAPGPGGGGVVPIVSPTLYRSMARGPGADVGSSDSGAMDWRGRTCPAWLGRELDAGTLSPGDRMVDAFDLVLIADCAEQKESMGEIRAKLQSSLSQQSFSLRRAGLGVTPSSGMGLEMQVTRLQVGDFAWAWRRRRTGTGARGTPITSGAQEEVLLIDCIVERKADHDIVGSIESAKKRYDKQKRRMRLSGLSRLIYLLEGQLAGFLKPTTGEDKSRMIRTTEADTLAQGFVIKRVQNHQETAAFLLSLSLQLMGAQGTETIRDFCANPCRPKVSLKEFSTAMNPGNLEPRTVNLQFAECLCLVHGLGPEGARVIAREFGTPKRFFDALRRCSTLTEQLDLVKNLKLSDGGKKASVRSVGPAAAQKLVSLFDEKATCVAAR